MQRSRCFAAAASTSTMDTRCQYTLQHILHQLDAIALRMFHTMHEATVTATVTDIYTIEYEHTLRRLQTLFSRR